MTTVEHWYEEGAATENPVAIGPGQFDNDQGGAPLPPGVHPMDPSMPWTGGNLPDATAANQDQATPPNPTGRKPFDTDAGQALAVFQRSAHDFTANRMVVDTNNAGTVLAAGRQAGRVSITLSVPSTAITGVVYGPSEGEVLNSFSSPSLLPGASVTLQTEAPVWVGVISGNTTGTVDVVVTFNPSGGVGGGQ